MVAPSQPSVICETSRLILRPTAVDDLEFVAALNMDAVVCRFLGGVKTVDHSRQKIDEAIGHQRLLGFSRWSVLLKQTGEPIGRCGPMVRQVGGAPEVELGYAFARAYWGRGYATEAAQSVVAYCFDVLDQGRVVAIIDPENTRSVRVAVKIGMTYERVIEWEGKPATLYVADTTL
jgi:[ribosomal protein S5]-alanine N-acetyltransferase